MRLTHKDMMIEEGDLASMPVTGYGDIDTGEIVVRVARFVYREGAPDEMAEVVVVKAKPESGLKHAQRLTVSVGELRNERYIQAAATVDD